MNQVCSNCLVGLGFGKGPEEMTKTSVHILSLILSEIQDFVKYFAGYHGFAVKQNQQLSF